MKRKIVIACSKKWFLKNSQIRKFIKKKNIYLITKKQELNLKILKKISPQFIFFPHWSYRVKESIFKKFTCICFHTAPLPFGRGGSPIQNMIKLGFSSSKVCALKMERELDAGPIYLKEKISLNGNLCEILSKISEKILIMMKKILDKKINPKKQVGKVVKFKRIKNNSINFKLNIKRIFDQIRMLDDPCYPNSYIKLGNYKIEFFKAEMNKNNIKANAKITKI